MRISTSGHCGVTPQGPSLCKYPSFAPKQRSSGLQACGDWTQVVQEDFLGEVTPAEPDRWEVWMILFPPPPPTLELSLKG